MSIKAITHIRRLRGGSQAQLMVADDGHEYVIKFQGNPQTTRVLANEYLAGRLARMIGLNVPEPAIIHVDAETIRRFDISFQLAGRGIVPPAGLRFGSRLIVDEEVHDWLPTLWLGKINNVRELETRRRAQQLRSRPRAIGERRSEMNAVRLWSPTRLAERSPLGNCAPKNHPPLRRSLHGSGLWAIPRKLQFAEEIQHATGLGRFLLVFSAMLPNERLPTFSVWCSGRGRCLVAETGVLLPNRRFETTRMPAPSLRTVDQFPSQTPRT